MEMTRLTRDGNTVLAEPFEGGAQVAGDRFFRNSGGFHIVEHLATARLAAHNANVDAVQRRIGVTSQSVPEPLGLCFSPERSQLHDKVR